MARRQIRFRCVPGLLSFRESLVLLAAFARLRTQPDFILIDGQGRAHPRRFGIACHIGILFDKPSTGCAKSRLVREHHGSQNFYLSLTRLLLAQVVKWTSGGPECNLHICSPPNPAASSGGFYAWLLAVSYIATMFSGGTLA